MKHGKLIGVNLKIPRSEMSPEQLEAVRKYDKEYRAKRRLNPTLKEIDRQTYHKCIAKNKEKTYKRNAEWRKKNWSKVYAKRLEPSNKVANMLRGRTCSAIKKQLGNKKIKSLDFIGCSIPELMSHLESKFYANISWENYGSYWHIDHVIPCSKFDLTKESEQSKCFHYSNLQPLTAKDNLKKGSKLIYNKIVT
jgi:hypothetical protein